MKINIYWMALLLEKNNITLPEGTRKKDTQDRDNQHDKRFQMGSLRSSKDQDLFAGGPKALNEKGKKNKYKTKFESPKKMDKN